MIVDLHCHTTASDGSLSPESLVNRALEQGVELLAITDHDSIDGYLQVRECSPVPLIPGVELSCVWGKVTIHVLGLNIDPDHPVLLAGLKHQQLARRERAHIIAQRLEKRGFKGAFEGACEIAGESQIGRPHFAQFLLNQGHVTSFGQAFKRYLGAGKACDVKACWPSMSEVVGWINDSGGVPVLAHPLHYKMTATKLRAMITDFKAYGGLGLEVSNGQQSPDKTNYLASLAQRFELKVSCGSDFHHPGNTWSELGQMADVPKVCLPVWTDW